MGDMTTKAKRYDVLISLLLYVSVVVCMLPHTSLDLLKVGEFQVPSYHVLYLDFLDDFGISPTG